MNAIKRILGYVVGTAATVSGVVTAVQTGGDAGVVVGGISTVIGLITGGSAAVKEISNDKWRPFFRWLGRVISQKGREKYGIEAWEKKEEKLNAGSALSFAVMANEEIQKGMKEDDNDPV